MHVKMRHLLPAMLAHVGEDAMSRRLQPNCRATVPTARTKPAIFRLARLRAEIGERANISLSE